MTRKYKIYKPYIITLLLCLLQVAGIDVYAQAPAKVAPHDSITVREAPKARARRHREINSPTEKDSLTVNRAPLNKDSITVLKIDSTQMQAAASIVADSLDKVNKKNLKEIETAVVLPQPKDTIPPAIPEKIWTPNPTKATWLAIVFPGGGQIYNRKFWKLPIIYGGFAGCAYALSWNGKMYKDYSQAYLDIMDSDPTTNSHLDILPPTGYSDSQAKEVLRKRKDMFRRYRDLSIFAFIGVYLISVIDAYVDAELSNFDITPDLSLRVEPTIINDQFRPMNKSVGVQCSFRF
ncbi:DUF5683 domain-containing protein [Bacteroides sp.]|uniref:DUF5683 domain-containing protein n=1 Tax=Bacteroides sp. TaxID=29523 RepID=UPI0025C30FF5|nr:DUF5683 domain-containing protein [Bacteroides sp.]